VEAPASSGYALTPHGRKRRRRRPAQFRFAPQHANAPQTVLPDLQENNAMSKKDLPPVPPAGRSNKGPSAVNNAELAANKAGPRGRNTDKQGRQGNIAANTRNQGYQQDR
jgi:hypothetical protein